MTIETEISRSGPYAGAGTTGPFLVNFRILDASHLRVIKLTSTGEVALAYPADYLVTGVGDPTSSLTTTVAVAVGETLTIVRDVPKTQEADYVQNDDFPAETHENALDKLTMIVQQLGESVDRSLTLPVSAATASTELPTPEANALIGWDAAATALRNVNPNTLATIVAFAAWQSQVFSGTGAQTAFVLSSDPGSINNLDIIIGGVGQRPNIDYTLSGTTLTFTSAPPAGASNISVRWGQALPQGTADDSQVAVNNNDTNEVERTLHFWIKAQRKNLCNYLTTAEVDDILSGTGSIDVATKFNNAMISAAASGGNRGAILELPRGLITVGSAVAPGNVSRVWVEGQGSGTRVQTTNATADIFTLGDSASECSGFVFSDFDVWSSVVKSAGYAFNNRICTDSQWRNVNLGSNDLYTVAGAHRLFRGWYFDRFDTVSVYGGQCVTSSDGLQARGIVGDTYGAELVIDGNLRFFRQNAAGAAAVRIGGCCGGVYLRRADASLATYGLVIDTTLVSGGVTATKRNREVFVEGFNVDSCKKWGIFQTTESVALLVMDKPWAASCGTDDDGSGGIWLGGGATVVPQIVMGGAPFIYNNVGPGIHSENGGYISIDGGQITQNGTSASGGHGVEFGATLPTRFSMTGTDVALNGKPAKGYGVNIPALLDNFIFSDCSIYGNAQGTINNAAGFSVTKIIRDCPGYPTENSGTATVPNGAASVVVPHGLATTPAGVLITPIGAPSVGTYSAGAYDATNFTIDNGAVAAGARGFAWRASVTGN